MHYGVALTLYHIVPTINNFGKEVFLKTVGKGENTDNQHFLLLHNVFYSVKDRNGHFSNISKLSFVNALNLVWSKICRLVKS